MTTTIRLQHEPFDIAAEVAKLSGGRTDVGAVVTFTGICRADERGAPIAALTLEHYPGMTERRIAEIIETAHARWQLDSSLVIHRVGRMLPGEAIVFVATASAHRAAALAACEFLIDWLKTKAPFWKLEETSAGERWVEPRAADDEAAARWA